jgi:hypothetical protein
VGADQTSGIVTVGADGIKRIHYRPHRTHPDKFIVCKLYLSFPLAELTKYLELKGLLKGAKYICGKHKHLFVIERGIWERAHEEELVEVETDVQGAATTGQYLLDMPNEEVEDKQYQHVWSL